MEPNNPTMQPNEAINLQEQATPPAQTGPSNGKTIAVVLLLIFFFPIGWILMLVWMKWPKWVKILISVLGVLCLIAMIGIIAALVLTAVNPMSTLDKARVSNVIFRTDSMCKATAMCLTDKNDIAQCDSVAKLSSYIQQEQRDVNFQFRTLNGTLSVIGETELSNDKACAYTCTIDPITLRASDIAPVNAASCGVE